MILKTKNAKQSWDSKDDTNPEILHVTRRYQYWLECFDPVTHQAIAKHVDTRDAQDWLTLNGYKVVK